LPGAGAATAIPRPRNAISAYANSPKTPIPPRCRSPRGLRPAHRFLALSMPIMAVLLVPMSYHDFTPFPIPAAFYLVFKRVSVAVAGVLPKSCQLFRGDEGHALETARPDRSPGVFCPGCAAAGATQARNRRIAGHAGRPVFERRRLL